MFCFRKKLRVRKPFRSFRTRNFYNSVSKVTVRIDDGCLAAIQPAELPRYCSSVIQVMIFFLVLIAHTAKQFFEINGEQGDGRQYGDDICNRFRKKDCQYIVFHENRKYVDQRDQYDDLRNIARKAEILEFPNAINVCWQPICAPNTTSPAI